MSDRDTTPQEPSHAAGVELSGSTPVAVSQNNDVNKDQLTGRARSLANLKMFPPGKSGNPAGRPKKKHITEIYEEIAETPEEREKIKQSVIAMLSLRDGVNVSMLREITDRLEGRAELSEPEAPREITINIVGIGNNQ